MPEFLLNGNFWRGVWYYGGILAFILFITGATKYMLPKPAPPNPEALQRSTDELRKLPMPSHHNGESH